MTRPVDELRATWERVHDAAVKAERRRRLLAWAGVAAAVLATAGAVLAILGVTR